MQNVYGVWQPRRSYPTISQRKKRGSHCDGFPRTRPHQPHPRWEYQLFLHTSLRCANLSCPPTLSTLPRNSRSLKYGRRMRTYDANIQRPQRALRDKYNGLYLIDISGFLDLVGIVNWIMLKMTIITILMIENSSCFSILPSLKTGIAHSSHSVIPSARWQWLGGRLCPHRCFGRKENSLKSFHSGKTRSGWVLV